MKRYTLALTTLYRPVGINEPKLIHDSGMIFQGDQCTLELDAQTRLPLSWSTNQ